jgi:hypothetical protein
MDFGGGSISGSAEAIRNMLALVGNTFEQNDDDVGPLVGAYISANDLTGLPPTRLYVVATTDNDLLARSYFASTNWFGLDGPYEYDAGGLQRARVPVPEAASAIASLAALTTLLAIRRC